MIQSFIKRLGCLTVAVLCSACVTLMPTAESPYLLGEGLSTASAASVGWKWHDARGPLAAENRATREGLVFGEAVLKPRSFEFIQAEFARAVAANANANELREKLRGKTIHLHGFEAKAGLWMRFSDQQQGNWDVMRATVVIELDGQRYESTDTHRFSNSDQPSPLSPAVRNAVEVLVNQIYLF